MKDHIVGRYRGFVIEARIEPRTIRSSDGFVLSYCVTWWLRTRTSAQTTTPRRIGQFADPLMYESESIALTCIDRSARALIDAMLADGGECTTSSPLLQSWVAGMNDAQSE
ncbi:hypothetical protein [Paraburkholderia diazotrophica]|uniref:Uncharacterized protein n=1 Tax=Paraburkholderia diazotrophica TaxID=667676 RepID=A0A1H7DVD4_9BURK|nr:hypothetical protein [Paraburkholderia diazotrophica]SEK05508.1 hypothetical protein SAMN05192539_103535 [Paraburkholderia diazotrophica]